VPQEPAERLAGLRVCVAGLGVSGPPAAAALAARGALVTAVDGRDDPERARIAGELSRLGVSVRLGDAEKLPAGTELVVTSPGWRPAAPLLAAARDARIPVIGDVELAWRLRPGLPDGTRQRWLGVTGTNGKTTTVTMLAAILNVAGHRAAAAGNVGTSAVEAVTATPPYPVLAVELSSFQLHWSRTLAPLAAVVLNIAGHHLDWHGDMDSYVAAKAKIYAPGTIAVCNADDPRTVALAAAAPAPRVVAFRRGEPRPGELGVAGRELVDFAFGDGAVLARVDDVVPAARHNVANALGAAALARAYGVPEAAVASGLRSVRPARHRISLVAQIGGVDYVDDSKATNPHAAAASLSAFAPVVWIAGGLFQGTGEELGELVRSAAPRLRAAVLIGADRGAFAAALARHAPDVPVVDCDRTDTDVMDLAVAEAARLAVPGDTVLLAPAAQSFDLFTDYPARGDAFAAAVSALAEAR
jgi:UDP-N-acetylmuramoylalanine--D-glutamate ligase